MFQEPGLQIIRLTGTPAALGQAHGRLLADQIKHLRRMLWRYLGRLTWGVGALPLYVFVCGLAWRFRRYVPAPFWEEMQALAHEAGVHVSFILFINVMDDLLNNTPRCSSFAAPLRQSQPTTFLLGRNLDYPLFAQTMCRYNTVQLVFPEAGIPYVALGWPGYIGVCTGMNQAQIALGQLTASTSDVSLAGMPAALRNRLALQNQESVSAVVAHLTSLPGTLGANLLIASPWEAVLLEVSAHHWALRLPQQGILTVTNHYQSPGMQAYRGNGFRRPPFSPLQPFCFSTEYSLARDQRLQELLCDRPLDIRRAQEILKDPAIANPCNVNSVIFDTAASEVYLAQGEQVPVSQRGRFRHLSGLFGPNPQVE